MKPKNKHPDFAHSAWLDEVASNERRCRALAMADLFARAATEPTHVADLKTDGLVKEGLIYLADDHIEELALLLKLTGGENE